MTAGPAGSSPHAPPPGRRRAARALRRHWPILVLAAAGVAVRAAAWLAIQPGWWYLGDSIGYVLDAIQPKPDPWRPNGYSILLLGPLLPAHQLAYVTALQHLMGLATGLVVYATVLRLRLPAWAAALAALPTLLDGFVVASEQMLLSEPLFTLLVVVACAILLVGPAGRWGVAACAGAGLLLGLAAITRTIALPLIVIAVAAVVVRRAGWLRPAALSLAFAVPVACYAGWFSQAYGQPNLTLSTGTFLYGRASQFVDCGRVALPDARLRALCPTQPVGQRPELFYVFSESSPLNRMARSRQAADSAAGRFAVAAIEAQPLDYAALVLRDAARSIDLETSWQNGQLEFRMAEPLPADAVAAGGAYQDRNELTMVYRPALVTALARYQRVLRMPGPIVLVALVVAALGLLLGRDPEARGLRPAVVLAGGAALVLVLAPAFITGVELRYRLPAIPLLGIAVAAGAGLLAGRLRPVRPAPVTS